jgi:hypothetical protein
MKRLLPAFALAAVLAVPASAKELSALSVCGTNGCHATHDRRELNRAMDVQPQAMPDHGAAFYRVRSNIGDRGLHDIGVMHSQWIPSLRLLRNDDGPLVEFSLPYPQTQRVLDRLSAGLKPFPAAKLGPIAGTPQTAKVDEVVAPPSAGSGSDDGGGGGSGWAWSLLAIAPAGLALWLLRRRRGAAPGVIGT